MCSPPTTTPAELDRLNPCGLTSSGAVSARSPDNAASPLLPGGTVILAYDPDTGDASVLRITNAGPYREKRNLDYRARRREARLPKTGVAALVISVLQSPTKAEASYVSSRVYPMVPGYLGRFATVDIALETAQTRFHLYEEGGTDLHPDNWGFPWKLPRWRMEFRGHSSRCRHRLPASW